MLSILIPTYNYNVFPLAKKLVELSSIANIDFELICIDDGSNSDFNQQNEKINKLKNSKFITRDKNLGLSSNRNELASLSKYDYLLFIDGDSVIINENYIKNYINSLNENIEIIYGGRIHPLSIGSNAKTLRWKYGVKIEDKDFITRKFKVYKTLMFNNTLIKRSCFQTLKFDSSIKEYGHEDTLLAYQLGLKKVKVIHINNAIEHGDIDSNAIFLKKTEKGLINLHKLYKLEKISPEFVSILALYVKLEKLKIVLLFSFLFKMVKKTFRSQLLSKHPSLLIFNFYKLGFLCSLKSDHLNN